IDFHFLRLRTQHCPSAFPYTTLFRSLALFVRVDSGSISGARLERREAGPLHAPLIAEFLDASDIHRAPDAAGFARREANRIVRRSEEHTSELQSRGHLVCRLLLEKKK